MYAIVNFKCISRNQLRLLMGQRNKLCCDTYFILSLYYIGKAHNNLEPRYIKNMMFLPQKFFSKENRLENLMTLSIQKRVATLLRNSSIIFSLAMALAVFLFLLIFMRRVASSITIFALCKFILSFGGRTWHGTTWHEANIQIVFRYLIIRWVKFKRDLSCHREIFDS